MESQKDWSKFLPMVEFAYNNAVHSTTGITPFMCLYGQNPEMGPTKPVTEVPEANEMADTLENQWNEAKAALTLSKECMQWETTGEVPTSFKIVERPFTIMEKISERAYHLELPNSLKTHDVFYIGLLSKVKEDLTRPFKERPPPKIIEGEEEYEVEAILDLKRDPDRWKYLLKW
ncbi:hypothetical protein RSAG8_03485, partial [Rhizoctonia solani AG-8 WAC10335]